MDRASAIAKLPEAHAAALGLRDDGFSNEDIAARLGLELEAVAPLLLVADAKLANIFATGEQSRQARRRSQDF